MDKRVLKIRYKDRDYECPYPKVGDFIDMKIEENTLSKGYQKDLLLSDDIESQQIYLFIKAVAAINVLFPQLKKELRAEDVKDLAISDFSQLFDIYINQIIPWLREWSDEFNAKVD